MQKDKPKILIWMTAAAVLLACCPGCKFYFGTFRWSLPRSHILAAEDLKKQGKFEEAVGEYKLHVEERLNDPSRPGDENPYFYYLLIGDCYLDLEDPQQARGAYLYAQEKEVTPELVAERLRRLGLWYEKKDRLEEALTTLQEYRKLDPLLFDLEIDRLHKEQIRREDAAE